MKAIAIFPFLLSSIVTYSQTKNADSLKLMLPLSSGIERADVLYDVAFELVDTDYNLALFYGRKARNAAKNTGDSLRVVKAGRITALAFRRLEMLDSSLSLSLQIIPIARRNSFDEELASLLNGVGLIYNFMAQFDYALEYYFESLEIRKRDGDPFDIGVVSKNIINKQKQKLNQILERKVRERTHELEFNRDVLQRSCDERDVLLQKMAADIRSSIATIKGLCTLAKKDASQVDRYLDEVYAASDNFYANAGKIINNRLAHQTIFE